MNQSGLERLRERSRLVLGNRYRAELMIALAGADEHGVCLGELAQSRRVPANVYQAPMKALLQARLAKRLPHMAGDRRRWYGRDGDARLWTALAEALGLLGGGEHG